MEVRASIKSGVLCSVWEYVACIYVLIAVVVWGPLTQRDGYVITPSTLYASLTQRRSQTANGTGNKALQKGSQHLRGEYLASVPPKVGWSQFFRNVVFWSAVVTLKVSSPGHACASACVSIA